MPTGHKPIVDDGGASGGDDGSTYYGTGINTFGPTPKDSGSYYYYYSSETGDDVSQANDGNPLDKVAGDDGSGNDGSGYDGGNDDGGSNDARK